MAMLQTTPRLFSIVLPVYNTPEDYLRACVDSLTAQTYPHWQAVLVDDGSQPETAALCDRLCAADARLQVIHQPNGGVSAARNRGIDAATGDYLLFVDPDDWVDANMLETLNDRLNVDAVDCLWYGKQIHARDSVRRLAFTTKPYWALDEAAMHDIPICVLDERKRKIPACTGSACILTIRRDYLTKVAVRFPVGVPIGEDGLFVMLLLRSDARMGAIPDVPYHYRWWENSAVRSYKADKLRLYEKGCAAIADYARTRTLAVQQATSYRIVRLGYMGLEHTLWHERCDLSYREKCRRWRTYAEAVMRDCGDVLRAGALGSFADNTMLRWFYQLGLVRHSYLCVTAVVRLFQIRSQVREWLRQRKHARKSTDGGGRP